MGEQKEQLDFIDRMIKVDKALNLIAYGLLSIPVILFTLIWIVVSLVIGYVVFKALFFS